MKALVPNYYKANTHLEFLIDRMFYAHEYLDQFRDLLTEAGRISATEFAPMLAQQGEAKCTLEKHVIGGVSYNTVRIPEQSRRVLDISREQGWFGSALPEEYGGANLPHTINGGLNLLLSEADMATFIIMGLTQGVAETLLRFASPELKAKYIPKLISDEQRYSLTGAMELTEPQAGSDLGDIKIKAVRNDCKWSIYGEKCFISNPDADVPIVLAREEGGPPGTKGLSMFLVPKHLDDGSRNAWNVEKLEDKMGIHSSPTGTVFFNGAEGYLVGVQREGFKQMLFLMNRARLMVGTQAIGVAERAFIQSASYASERKQFGKTLDQLPLMQEHLATMRINIEAATSLLFRSYGFLDDLLREGESAARTGRLVRILTPLSKYRGTELGRKMATRAIMNFGGYGYIREYIVERLLRDVIITSIYEGTNDIQSLDVLRSHAKEGTVGILFENVASLLRSVRYPRLKSYAARVKKFKWGLRLKLLEFASSVSPPTTAQTEARKFAGSLIRLYESALMLEEAQYQIDNDGNYRKAVMAMKYIDDSMPIHGMRKNIGTFFMSGLAQVHLVGSQFKSELPPSVKYFNSIVRYEKLKAL